MADSEKYARYESVVQVLAASVVANKVAAVLVVFDPDAAGQDEVGVAVIGISPELEAQAKRFAVNQLRRGLEGQVSVLQGVVPEA